MSRARIVAIGTALPRFALSQTVVRDLFLAEPGLSRLGRRLVTAAFDGADVATRHTVIGELVASASTGDEAPRFLDPDGRGLVPLGTGARNAVYARECPPLALAAARRAIESAPGLDARAITHVVTVSCTGFMAPGVDYRLVRDLGLDPATRRLHVGFMGCYGAFPALRAAVDSCAADPDAVVLVVCVELCSLHLRPSDDQDAIVASSIFADGAAATIVTARPTAGAALRVDALHTVLIDDSADEMAWRIGDQGFEMTLSGYVPRILEATVEEAIAPLRPPGLAAWRDVEHWAIHPGGRSILDRVQRALALRPEQLAPSRAVLREDGNMSSPTVLFVLERILAAGVRTGERVGMAAFGPGLTVESALLTVEAAR